jgi:hypothetical protein
MAWVRTVLTGTHVRIEAAVKAQITRVGFMTSPSAYEAAAGFTRVSGKERTQLQGRSA